MKPTRVVVDSHATRGTDLKTQTSVTTPHRSVTFSPAVAVIPPVSRASFDTRKEDASIMLAAGPVAKHSPENSVPQVEDEPKTAAGLDPTDGSQLDINEAIDSIFTKNHIPAYARVEFCTSLVANGTSFEFDSYSHLQAVVHTPEGKSCVAVLDTCSSPSLIDRQFLGMHFPSVTAVACEPFRLGGIGSGGPGISTVAHIPVIMQGLDGFVLSRKVPVYVADSLSCKFILGGHFLRKNKLHIQWGNKHENDHLVTEQGQSIPVTSSAPRRPAQRREVQVYAARDFCIPAGHGYNAPVRHRALPVTVDGYSLQPITFSHPRKLSLGSLIHAVTTGQDSVLPFAYFGTVSLTIHAGQRLGTLRRVTIAPTASAFVTDTDATIALGDLLGDEDLEPDPEDPRRPDGYPFHVPQDRDEDPPDVKADISDHWGPEFRS